VILDQAHETMRICGLTANGEGHHGGDPDCICGDIDALIDFAHDIDAPAVDRMAEELGQWERRCEQQEEELAAASGRITELIRSIDRTTMRGYQDTQVRLREQWQNFQRLMNARKGGRE
jgi:hypothetical protein